MNLREIMLKNEKHLSNYASYDRDSIRLESFNDDFRPNYFRDIDRIIHTLSYTRYMDKTQVFTHWQDDNISKRIIHVQLVSKIARTIGRALSLNEDLIEAIALGHDLGHIPFGHPGESMLDEISREFTNCHFAHNVQSVRDLMYVENNGLGINASIQVLDGILCHNGEIVEGEYTPRPKSKEEFLEEYEKCYNDSKFIKTLRPMTLEGCVVRISDVIGYLGRDIEDAIRLNVIKKEDLPENITKVLGSTNAEIVDTIIKDIIKNSLDKPYIKLSDEILHAIKELKDFNYKNIYHKAYTEETINFYKKAFRKLFVHYLENINSNDCSIKNVFIDVMSKTYLENTSDERKVIDYIAGMTDEFFIKEYERIENNEK